MHALRFRRTFSFRGLYVGREAQCPRNCKSAAFRSGTFGENGEGREDCEFKRFETCNNPVQRNFISRLKIRYLHFNRSRPIFKIPNIDRFR